MRVSDRARNGIVRQLGRDYARGYLSVETLAWRVERALAARTNAQLATLRADVPPEGPLRRLGERWGLLASRRRRSPIPCKPPLPTAAGESYLLGRWEGCDLVLDDVAVSRMHAALRFDAGRWIVTDLGSKNGTRVNGWKIGEAQLSDGDVLALGSTRLRFLAP